MKNTIKGFIIGILVTLLVFGTIGYAAAKTQKIDVLLNTVKINVDSKNITSKTIVYKDILYVPIQTIADTLKVTYKWDKTKKTATLVSENITLSDDSGTIESTIDGEFEGWDGSTIFKLVNGQIWQQKSYSYTYHYAYRPSVRIIKDGSKYIMQVDGVSKTIEVVRIK